MNLTFYKYESEGFIELPFIEEGIKAGFPSPAADFEGKRISLDKELIKNETATFFARVDGDSMINAGMSDGDLLVIDRSLEPQSNKIAVCMLDGEFTVKRLRVTREAVYLVPENKSFSEIKVEDDQELVIWGIVTYVIKKV
ncbi:LexA family transcriptional regulator [Wenyingzhuangia sp. 2_MG-2023]|uniref:LexA family protein n=1 Tax=Wenyingzhuangia sp. 2_MG-2023 TaxID=3062639 RepID=UPI0026E2D5C1|nr:translesion error-prone DNA polymerase V autoproteolytic subunit [Wenyingzhuangia sp. 2_MG-2023]MDO6739256.1 translesion error-prone DNA polymerase V autoproteolytic subunit [Wenyingzhuangia sp. 2_MG-2023]MDO6803425.1 translesion error-prone DNA polymerase V autoproteolytic subunit [Wenyingzhuangia sp. 1_MG-2023]